MLKKNVFFVIIIFLMNYVHSQQQKTLNFTHRDYDNKVISKEEFNVKLRDTVNYTDAFKVSFEGKKTYKTLIRKKDGKTLLKKPNYVSFEVKIVPNKIKSYPWEVVLEDKANDGRSLNSLDGKSLAYFYDKKDAIIWFRLTYYSAKNILPAISISIDTDNNQSNGVNWYGTNHSFKLDKMISVGPISEKDGIYSGYNGITDSEGINKRDWINISSNTVKFYHDAANQTLYSGVFIKDLEIMQSQTISFIGSVGSNATWNDDIGDNQYATVKIH